MWQTTQESEPRQTASTDTLEGAFKCDLIAVCLSTLGIAERKIIEEAAWAETQINRPMDSSLPSGAQSTNFDSCGEILAPCSTIFASGASTFHNVVLEASAEPSMTAAEKEKVSLIQVLDNSVCGKTKIQTCRID